MPSSLLGGARRLRRVAVVFVATALTVVAVQPAIAASPVGSTTLLSVDAPASVAGQPVTITATVTAAKPVTGKVTFSNGTTALKSVPLVNGSATYATSKLPVGALSLSASFGGSPKVAASMSTVTTGAVARAPTTAALSSDTLSATAGQSVTLTAIVSAQDPSTEVPPGKVKFASHGDSLGIATLSNGVAKLTTTALAAGKVAAKASYVGSNRMAASESSAVRLTTTTQLSSASAEMGAPLYLTAFVGPSVSGSHHAGGSVSFTEGSTVLGAAAVSGGYASTTVSTLPVGAHPVVATYGGDGTFAPSPSSVAIMTIAPATATVVIAANVNPVAATSSVTFTATVVPSIASNPAATGTIDFTDGGMTIMSAAPIVDGAATFTTSSLGIGAHHFAASYHGDGAFGPATSPTMSEVVTGNAAAVALASDHNPATPGQLVTFTATVTASGSLSGSVIFRDNGAQLAVVGVSGHSATFATSTLGIGSHPITADYNGDATNAAASSAVLSQTIGFPGFALLAWGQNANGQLGLASAAPATLTTPTAVGTDASWAQVSGAVGRSAAVRSDGTLWTWGTNAQGQLGVGNHTGPQTCPASLPANAPCSTAPVQVGTSTAWASVSAGGFDTLAIKTDGSLWGWGWNLFGELGDGTTTERDAPIHIGSMTWKQVSVSADHAVAIAADGTVWAWGSNGSGGLGDHTTTARLVPTPITTTTDWRSVQAGAYDTEALTTEGTLWAWGDNSHGQLGDGSTTNRPIPEEIGVDTNWRSISAGGDVTAAVKTDGTLWAWGWDAYGQLGDGRADPIPTNTYVTAPQRVGTDTGWASVSAGEIHVTAIKSNGTMWSAGLNTTGELGDGSTTERHTLTRIGLADRWTAPSAGGGTHSLALSAAPLPPTTLVPSSDRDPSYTFDPVTFTATVSSPAGVPTGTVTFSRGATVLAAVPVVNGIATFTTSPTASFVVTAVFDSADWQPSNASLQQVVVPRPTVVHVSVSPPPVCVGDSLSIVASVDSVVSGSLTGTVTISDNGATLAVKDLSFGIVQVSDVAPAIGTHTITASYSGDSRYAPGARSAYPVVVHCPNLFAWGDDAEGELGDGGTRNQALPEQIGTRDDWAQISVGWYDTMAIAADGSLWSWGENLDGALGDGTGMNRGVPGRVGTATWRSVSAGSGSHTMAIRSDGTLWGWGSNLKGEIGDGTTDARHTPVQIGTDSTWASVASESAASLAIKDDGTLWSWGWNSDGQLGNPAVVEVHVPTQVGTATNWQTIITGPGSAFATRRDGTLWAWGYNGSGQLGDGTTKERTAPVQVGTATNWVRVTAGGVGTAGWAMAIRADGSLWGWGGNAEGELGDGSTTERHAPRPIAAGSTWSSVAAGTNFTRAVRSDGTLWGWGISWGDTGPLHQATTTPVQIGTGRRWSSVAAATHAVALQHS